MRIKCVQYNLGEKVKGDVIKDFWTARQEVKEPHFRVGDAVRAHAQVKKGRCVRVQLFEGTVLGG